MQDEAFRLWLKARGFNTNTQISDARRINKKVGDLDQEFAKDRLKSLISSLIYTKEDMANRRADDSGFNFTPRIPVTHESYYRRIQGSFRNYRRIAEFYVEFRDETDTAGAISPEQGDQSDFDPLDKEDGRKKTIRSITARRGQHDFRNKLRKAYGDTCAISGCSILDVLEAAHITPYLGKRTNHVTNGLLLRADLHTLFDCGLIAVDPAKLAVVVSPKLSKSEYAAFAGERLRPTASKGEAPNVKALGMHMKDVFGQPAVAD